MLNELLSTIDPTLGYLRDFPDHHLKKRYLISLEKKQKSLIPIINDLGEYIVVLQNIENTINDYKKQLDNYKNPTTCPADYIETKTELEKNLITLKNAYYYCISKFSGFHFY